MSQGSYLANCETFNFTKNELVHEYFSRHLDTRAENLLKNSSWKNCLPKKAPKSDPTECFSVDTFQDEKKMIYFPFDPSL